MSARTFQELLIDELKDVYDAERRLVRSLPKLVKAAHDPALRSALENHLTETEGHVDRLERCFEQLGENPARKTCKAMEGILEECDSMLKEADDGRLRDALIIAAAQKVEHYEIATYGTLRDWSRQLGHSDIASTCQTTLDEEERADKLLTVLSAELNTQAARTHTEM